MKTTPVKIVETVLRDGHQSLEATRMRTSDMVPALEQLDDVGYYALEAWGGATFDTCLRYLDEDPWERLRTIRKHVRKTKLQMLLRGQNILGYSQPCTESMVAIAGRPAPGYGPGPEKTAPRSPTIF
jgi:oxaloacetate decarboxylase alpha subunit